MMRGRPPKVTCICDKWDDFAQLRRAITCFLYQDYPYKSLVIKGTDIRTAIPSVEISSNISQPRTSIIVRWGIWNYYLPWFLSNVVDSLKEHSSCSPSVVWGASYVSEPDGIKIQQGVPEPIGFNTTNESGSNIRYEPEPAPDMVVLENRILQGTDGEVLTPIRLSDLYISLYEASANLLDNHQQFRTHLSVWTKKPPLTSLS